MARVYRPRAGGLYEVETPGVGFMPVPWSEEQLQGHGFVPYQGATAFVGDTEQGGTGNVPDVPREVPGAGETPGVAPDRAPGAWDPSQGGAPPMLPNEGAQGAPSDPALQTPTPAEERKPGGGGRAPVRTKPLSAAGADDGSQRRAQGAPRYHTTKARDVRAAYRVEKGAEFDPADEKRRDDAESNLRIIEKDLADKGEARTRRDAADFEERNIRPLERQVSAAELRAERIRKDHEKRQGEIDREREAVDKLEVNPRKMFEDEPWTMMLAAVSMIAGGIQSARRGGPNQAVELMQRAIDTNVEMQKEKIRNRREGLRDKETELERLTKIYGSPDLAEAEFRDRQEALAQAWAKKNLMVDAADDVQQNLRAAWSERDGKRADERMARDLQFGERITEEWRHQPAQTFQVGGPRPIKPKDRALAVTLPGGGVKYGRTEVDARGAREKITAGVHLDRLLGNVEAMVERGKGDRLWWDENRGNIQANMTAIAATYKDSEKLGTFDAGVERLLAKGVGEPDALLGWDDATIAKLGENRRLVRSKIQNIADYELDDTPDSITPGAGSTFRAESDR